MNVDQQLRESLQRRAESVEPSPGGWAAIARRIERRQKRTRTLSMSLVAGMSFAAVVLAVVMVTGVGPKPDDQNVAATGGFAAARPTTTVLPSTDPESPTDGSSPSTVVGEIAAPGLGDTTGGSIAARPGEPNATGRNYTPEAVWPETLAELERIQASVDDGQESWRNDPRAVATAYLADRGISSPGVGEPSAGANPEIRWALSSMVGGRVYLSRLVDGSIYYVSRSESDDISEIHAVRQGPHLAVDVTARVPGTLDVRAKQPGSEWNDGAHRTVVADQQVSLSVPAPESTPLIVQARLEANGEIIAVTETYLGQSVLGFDDGALHNGSPLRFGGLGPVSLDMTLAEAERAAGVNMITNEGEHCTSLDTMGRPPGVSFLALNGSGRVDVIVVSDVGVRTAGGIGYGSTLDEVRDAYPDAEERVTDGRGRVVLRPSGSDPAGYEIVLSISEDEVNLMWSGREGLSMSDELCA